MAPISAICRLFGYYKLRLRRRPAQRIRKDEGAVKGSETLQSSYVCVMVLR